VCAVRAENAAPVLIRSYRRRAIDNLYDHIKIWEAARATSAASTFFEPITIGKKGQKFIDGGLKYNNPIEMADMESRALWPDDERMIISIGTGSAPGKAIKGNIIDLARRLADIVVEADETNNRFRESHPQMVDNNQLFRFTVSQGLASVGLEEYKAVPDISTHTETYLNDSDIVRLVEACVRTMRTSGQRLNLTAPGL
jgi:predicted acylesterase/phospholipase RssA